MKNSKITKTLSILCALCLLFSVFAQGIVVNAADEAVPQGVLESAQENVQEEQPAQDVHEAQNEELQQEEQAVEDSQASTPKSAKDLLPPLGSIKTLPAQTGDGENPWSLGLVFYDSTVDNGQTPLTEINWNASHLRYTQGESRLIKVQITCMNDDVDRDYEEGEVVISIPNLVYNTYGNDPQKPNWSSEITADANYISSTQITQGKDWNFDFDEKRQHIDNKKELVFTNHKKIEKDKNFVGHIQFEFTITSNSESYPEEYLDFCDHNHNYEGQATLKVNDNQEPLAVSNSVSLSFERHYEHKWGKEEYTLKKNKSKPTHPEDFMSENAFDYYWVDYNFTVGTVKHDPKSGYVKWRTAYNQYIKDSFLKECKLYSRTGEPITPYGYDETGTKAEYHLNGSITVAYPKNIYKKDNTELIESGDLTVTENGDLIVNNTAYLYGTYQGETLKEELAQDSIELNLAEYSFNYPPGNYDVNKGWLKPDNGTDFYYNDIVSSDINSIDPAQKEYRNVTSWLINPTVEYPGSKIDVEFGDDLLLYENINHENVWMQDTDYRFDAVCFPTLRNALNAVIPNGKYDVDLYVRYAGEENYTLFDSFKNQQGKYFDLTQGEKNVVGYYFIIKDMTESISVTGDGKCYTRFYMKNIPETGNIHNFSYIKVYKDNGNGGKERINVPNETNYPSDFIANKDQEKYHEYRQRSEAIAYWEIYNLPRIEYSQSCGKTVGFLTNKADEERFTSDYTINFKLLRIGGYYQERYKDFYHPEDMVSFLGIYDLLPAGIDLETTKEELLSSLFDSIDDSDYSSYSNFSILDKDFQPIDESSFKSLLKNNAEIKITPNWRGGQNPYSIAFQL